ncbi:MAG: SDR family oxidoreductase [Paludibacteraceae bacterium]|nr:SDR family oxidoreductase [Paludibacteraceae bacterium]
MSKENIVFLTGGSAGLGKATAELLMRNGYTVYSASRRLAERQEDPNHQGKIIPLQMDVTDTHSIATAVAEVMEKEGRIDILICNAGNGIAGAIEDTSAEEAKFQFETNFFGTVNVVHEILPIMRKQMKGKIITTSSVAGFIPIPYQGFYSASKAAVKIFTQTLSIEMKPFNVQCCCVMPGDAKTEFTQSRKFTQASQAPESVYTEKMNKAVGIMAHDEQNGMLPVEISKAILTQIRKKKMSAVSIPGIKYKVISFAFRLVPNKFLLFVVDKLYS